MKKKTAIIVLSLALTQLFYAQDSTAKKEYFGIGINGGFTLGDYEDIYGSNVGLDIVYLRQINRKIYLGGATGFTNYFGDTVTELGIEVEYDDLQFIPIAASLRFNPFKNFYVGPDVGYAIGINDGNDGGFYVSPRVSYLLNEKLLFYAGYRSISLDNSLGSLQFGIGYNF